MGFYQFRRKQFLKQPIKVIWDFMSNPKNLKTITPDYMGFDITSKHVPDEMYEGIIISYKVSPLFNIKTTWVTEITKIEENKFFIDEQRIGPYNFWHHQHHLEEKSNGTEMLDIVSYQPPFGILGDLANKLIIKNKLEEIFDFRYKKLEELFNES